MNTTTPKNLIIHNDTHRTLIPWNWLLRITADQSTSTVELIFSGLKVLVTTPKPNDLLEAVSNGQVHRLKVAPVKAPASTDFVVDSITLHNEDDEDGE